METDNAEKIRETFRECTKYKFFQKEQLERFDGYIDTMSGLKEFKFLNIEYLDMVGSICFYFNLGKGITLDVTFYPNDEICYSISAGGSVYVINNDLTGREIVDKMNNVMDKLK